MKSKSMAKHVLFVAKLIYCKIFAKKMPLIVILCVTNKCNLNCWYCYGEHPYRKQIKDFSTDEILDVIKRLKRMGTCVLQFQGGEPLLRDDIKDVVLAARDSGMVCDMVTNGILISEKQDIIKLLDKVCISLDGPLDINDANRGKGTFNKIVDGIDIVCKLGVPVRISSVLTQDTKIDHIDWLINFCSKRNILVNFSPSFEFIGHFRDGEFKPHNILDKDLRDIFKYIEEQKRKDKPVQFSANSYSLAAQWPFSYKKRQLFKIKENLNPKYPRCYHGKHIIFIDSDGGLYPCCNFWGKSNLNIMTDGLENAIKKLNNNGCFACYIPAYLDRNLFFDGNLFVWANYIKQALKGGL